jgi:VanZ family protein
MRAGIFAFCSVVWMSLIFILSSMPGDELGPDMLTINLIKKAGHVVIFGVLTALYYSLFQGRKRLADTGGFLFILSLFLTVLYAISDEYHQSFTLGRHSSGYDVIIDACGAIMALSLLYKLKNRKNALIARASMMEKSAPRKASNDDYAL